MRKVTGTWRKVTSTWRKVTDTWVRHVLQYSLQQDNAPKLMMRGRGLDWGEWRAAVCRARKFWFLQNKGDFWL